MTLWCSIAAFEVKPSCRLAVPQFARWAVTRGCGRSYSERRLAVTYVTPYITQVRLVIFDCDGVLVDTERAAVELDQRMLAELGWHLSRDEVVERFMGRSTTAMMADIEQRLGTLPPDFTSRYDDANRQILIETSPVPGVVKALDAIQPRVATCVASSGSRNKMRISLGAAGLWDRFSQRIFSACDVPVGKPAPDLFLHAAKRLGVDSNMCAVVEDSAFGVAAARAAGMRSYGFTGSLSRGDQLAGPNTVLFGRMEDLPGLVLPLIEASEGCP
jgi:HAD superfamily hydrolase (TIGR01509 family)